MPSIASEFYVKLVYQVRSKNQFGDNGVFKAVYDHTDEGKAAAEAKARELQDANDLEQKNQINPKAKTRKKS
jgi:hypothetical protein